MRARGLGDVVDLASVGGIVFLPVVMGWLRVVRLFSVGLGVFFLLVSC